MQETVTLASGRKHSQRPQDLPDWNNEAFLGHLYFKGYQEPPELQQKKVCPGVAAESEGRPGAPTNVPRVRMATARQPFPQREGGSSAVRVSHAKRWDTIKAGSLRTWPDTCKIIHHWLAEQPHSAGPAGQHPGPRAQEETDMGGWGAPMGPALHLEIVKNIPGLEWL